MKATLDPTSAFKGVSRDKLIGALGLIPQFGAMAFLEHPEGSSEDIYGSMVSAYGFGDMRHTGGSVSPEGVYSYPEDPELPPLVVLQQEGSPTKVYVYQHAIIAVVDSDNTIFSRMD